MSYNFLKEAKYIRNSPLCRHDSVNGYSSEFAVNGDVDGWNIYNNIYMYGCWNGVLFGSSYSADCHIGRTEVFLSVEAETYYFIEFMMLLEDNNKNAAVPTLTKGKVQWKRTDDSDWSTEREIEFDISKTDTWQYYKINVGPKKWWQGAVNDIKFYPFIDGREGDKFFIKFIRISSEHDWTCSNTQCSFFQEYSHPCQGIGDPAYCKSLEPKTRFTTTSGINSSFIIDIDNYGKETFELGNNTYLDGISIARIIGNKLSTLNIGGYSYIDVYYTDNDTFKISSGTNSNLSSVNIPYSKAAEELGFYKEGLPTYTTDAGRDPASGFDYASTRQLQTFELNSVIDGNLKLAYTHNPNQFSVEAGRRDYNEIGTPVLLSELSDELGYVSFNGSGKTTIDFSHRVDNNGRLTHLWVFGVALGDSKFKVFRPHNDGGFTYIASVDIDPDDPEKLYTRLPIVSRADCDILVNKGDLIAVYNVDLYVGVSLTGLPDATFCQYSGDVEGRVEKTQVYSYGVGGFSMYARGNLAQNNTIVDIDLGNRLNVSEFRIFGKEKETTFEFNLASCLDVTWEVDLFGHTHWHSGYTINSIYGWSEEHTNVYHGKECLDDCVRTADNGQAGESYSNSTSQGLASYGTNHSYFYVNGDAEWLYDYDCNNISEFCGGKVPTSFWGFERDPIAFTLYFPNNTKFEIHKSIIYFKEESNFRNLTLSTFNDPYYTFGNADDDRFDIVESFEHVFLNGTKYSPGDNQNVDNYVFKSPMTDDLYNFSSQDNNTSLISAVQVDWSILGHEFSPRTCKGFRYYTDKHKSTKIMEIEVYSKITNDATLEDNAIVYFSDYGDDWRTAGFVARGDSVYAYIGSTPRYFRLVLESQAEFYINEIDVTVTDQVYVEDEVILLEDAKAEKVGRSKSTDIINVYDRPFDLSVDIPKDLGLVNNIVCWNKLGSEEERSNPGIGPTPIYYKSEDFPITMYHGQCATMGNCYALDNLIDGKLAYFSNNGVDWEYYGVLEDGVSVDVCNFYYARAYTHTFDFLAVSSKYWKFQFLGLSAVHKVRDVIPYFGTSRINNIDYVYFESDFYASSQDSYIASTGVDILGNYALHDDFEDGDYSYWILYFPGVGTKVEENGYLELTTTTTDGYAITSQTFINDRDFEFVCEQVFIERNLVGQYLAYIEYVFYNGSTEIMKIILRNDDLYNTPEYTWRARIYFRGAYISDNDTILPDGLLLENVLTKIRVLRSGTYVSLYIDSTLIQIRNISDYVLYDYFNIDNTVINKVKIECSGQAIKTMRFYDVSFRQVPLISPVATFGLKLQSNTPIDNMKLVIDNDLSLNVDVYTSYNNSNNYTYYTSSNNELKYDLYYRFLIDLGYRHHVDIIRNYGNGFYKHFISKDNGSVVFSNNDISTIETDQLISSYTDSKLLVVKLLCSDGAKRCLDKLGIYSDLKTSYCLGGGYNHTWKDLGTIFTEYNEIKNVAFGASVSGTITYYEGYTPEKAVDGVSSSYDTNDCWGYKDESTPELYIDFGEEVTINSIVIYGGYHPEIVEAVNKGYIFSTDNTVSGTNYEEVFTVTGLTRNTTYDYTFSPVTARRAKLSITDFDGLKMYEQQDDGFSKAIYVGFLREVEIYTYTSSGEINSEDYPVVCVDVKSQFNIVDHKLITERIHHTIDYGWDNDDNFFMYSDFSTDNPEKVVFDESSGLVSIYHTSDSSGNQLGKWEYIFDRTVFIPQGNHYVSWDAYYPENYQEISLVLEGDEVITCYAETLGAEWVTQKLKIFVANSGYFTILVRQNISEEYTWGGKEPHIYRISGLTKWVAITRNTATDYAYDNVEDNKGLRYLSKVELYSDTKHIPTEYNWWWTSDLSSLYNDSTDSKVGSSSLVVAYPSSTAVDNLRLIKGDTFGLDGNWNALDLLSFWWYIDNVYSLDTSYGDITLGAINNSSSDFYYRWSISNLNLDTGWNYVSLSFTEYSGFYPYNYESTKFLHGNLDIKNTSREFDELTLRYKGTGNNTLKMKFDDFKIRRNIFDSDVKFGKGLCLTGSDHMVVPLSNVTLDKGSIECWLKLGVDTLGRDSFSNLNAATVFTVNNNNNDIIALRIKPTGWFEVLAGNIRLQSLFNLDEIPAGAFIGIGELVHIGLVWSNNGTGMDNNDTIRVYINGQLRLVSDTEWEVNDTKLSYFKLGGGITQTDHVFESFSAFVYDNIKVYNFCKSNFSINKENVDEDYIYLPENFIEISKDDINFYGLGSEQLPFVFEQVPSGDSVRIYVRSKKDKRFSATNSTAQVIIDWLTTV